MMRVERIQEARIVALLLTDGGITRTHFDRPRSWRIHFTSAEHLLREEFKNNIEFLFGRQNCWASNPKNANVLYINSSDLAEHFLQFSTTYRKKQCSSFPICPKLRGKSYGPCLQCKPITYEGAHYPPATIPKIRSGLVSEFLEYYFSAEGTVTDRI